MICFSAVDSESHMDILRMIVEFVERGLIDDIAKATTYEELLEVIKRNSFKRKETKLCYRF